MISKNMSLPQLAREMERYLVSYKRGRWIFLSVVIMTIVAIIPSIKSEEYKMIIGPVAILGLFLRQETLYGQYRIVLSVLKRDEIIVENKTKT